MQKKKVLLRVEWFFCYYFLRGRYCQIICENHFKKYWNDVFPMFKIVLRISKASFKRYSLIHTQVQIIALKTPIWETGQQYTIQWKHAYRDLSLSLQYYSAWQRLTASHSLTGSTEHPVKYPVRIDPKHLYSWNFRLVRYNYFLSKLSGVSISWALWDNCLSEVAMHRMWSLTSKSGEGACSPYFSGTTAINICG